MSIFTSSHTKTLNVPGDADSSVVIRALAPKHLERAARDQQKKALADFRDMGGAEFMRELKELGPSTVKSETAADPLLLFDRITLLEKGIVSWTYEQPLTREMFEDVEESTQEFLAREILRLSKPSLFQTDEEREAARKNEPGSCIVH